MKIFHSQDEFDFADSVVALGNFDGLHIAHITIIQNSINYALTHKTHSGVILFDKHASKKTMSRQVSIITTTEQKIEILKKIGVDFVYIMKFDDEFMKKSPEEFAKLLVDDLKIKAVCVGYDYRFGYKACGNTKSFEQFGRKYNFDVLVAKPIMLNGEIVGSTNIRKFINCGQMEKASLFLGRNFFVDGEVVRGFQNGKKMGIPTANICYSEGICMPAYGVYAGITYVNGKRYRSVINVGKNPTFNAEEVTIESHILSFNKDIYGKIIRVEFVKKLRDDKKFSSVEELKNQIHNDIVSAMDINI